MQIARTRYIDKIAVLSLKKTSCRGGGGWLRPLVHTIFAVITTVSFILIVIMACRNASQPIRPPSEPLRCTVRGCRVTCHQTPYYGRYDNEILTAVTVAEGVCNRVVLDLNEPMFENNRIPNNWLAPLRSNIHELSIIKGNLNHLPSSAFISQFTSYTKTLTLRSLAIKTWTANSLVGFSSLENLNVIDSKIHYIQVDSLRAVDDTLKTLTVTYSGQWDPANVTGSRGFEKLHIVDFSNNDFHRVLGEDSFVGLEHCKILYLNSCGIVRIGAGAFDHLKSIEVLYLNNNRLVTIPPGLFHTIVTLENPKPRISMQDNFWHCSCVEDDLRQLVRKEIVIVEATCVYPEAMNGITFTEFDNSCEKQTEDLTPTTQLLRYNYDVDSNLTYVHGTCQKTHSTLDIRKSLVSSRAFQLVTPKKCSLNKTKFIDISLLSPKAVNGYSSNQNNSWLTFSYFFQTTRFNALQVGVAETHDYGLLWFQSDCPLEMYCMDSMPTSLRIFDIDQYSQFTFCPLRLSTGDIEEDRCVAYFMDSPKAPTTSTRRVFIKWLLYFTLVLICTSFGAIAVYSLIRAKPTLLKGSKRILFVKHKKIEALVLPPKVPLPQDAINDTCKSVKNNIFTLYTNDSLKAPKFNTMKSMRSNKSGSPSYISAFQPSEDQLAEWRISNHFNNDLTISSKSELSTLWVCGDAPYYSLDGNDTTYESLK